MKYLFYLYINSRFGKEIRRKYYLALLDYIEYRNPNTCFLCLFKYHNSTYDFLNAWYADILCWKELKECKQLKNSEFLMLNARNNLNCDNVCFAKNANRIAFIENCLSLLTKQDEEKN